MSDFRQKASGVSGSVFGNRPYRVQTFDFMIVDECHRSIYKLWRQVLEYFNELNERLAA